MNAESPGDLIKYGLIACLCLRALGRPDASEGGDPEAESEYALEKLRFLDECHRGARRALRARAAPRAAAEPVMLRHAPHPSHHDAGVALLAAVLETLLAHLHPAADPALFHGEAPFPLDLARAAGRWPSMRDVIAAAPLPTLAEFGLLAAGIDREAAALEPPAASPPPAMVPEDDAFPEVRVDTTSLIAIVDGALHQLESRTEATFVAIVAARRGEWIKGQDLLPLLPVPSQPARVLHALPAPVRDLIESRPGRGFRLKPYDAHAGED